MIEHLMDPINAINGGHLFLVGVFITSHQQVSIKASCEGIPDNLIKYEKLVRGNNAFSIPTF